MTQTDAPTPASRDDWLDRVLADAAREHAAAYIGDDGFTARVMDALPAPDALPRWRKPAVAALWGVAAVGIASALPETFAAVSREAYHLLSAQPVSLLNVAIALAALAAATWGGAAYVLRED
jgi:hypothetical protein